MNYGNHQIVIPYNGLVHGGIYPGKIIKIAGNVPPHANHFAINLICGPKGDIAFHVSLRFLEQRVVFNSVQMMAWGHEESHSRLPLNRGQFFDIIILCEAVEFKVAINGQHFGEFRHRVPIHLVTNLGIDGDVHVTSITYEERTNNNIGFPPNLHQPSCPYPPQHSGVSGYAPSGHHHHHHQNYHHQTPYPTQPGVHLDPKAHDSSHYNPHSPSSHKKVGILDKAGMAVAGALGASTLLGGGPKYNKLGMLGAGGLGATMAGAALTGHLNPKKAMKKQSKAHKKALKYGLPIAGAGLGVYALGKGVKKLGHRRSSSSSSSSSSD